MMIAGAGGDKGGGGPVYTPHTTGNLENLLAAQAMGTAIRQNPNLAGVVSGGGLSGAQQGNATGLSFQPQMGGGLNGQNLGQYGINAPQVDYQGYMDQLRSGKLLGGQQIPTYKGPGDFKFKTPQFQQSNFQPFEFKGSDLSKAPTEQYARANEMNREQVLRQQQAGQEQANRSFGARGIGNSGLAQGAGTSLARAGQQQIADSSRQLGMEQANQGLQNMQFGTGLEQGQRQFGAQLGSGERQFLAGMQANTQAQQNQANLQRAAQSLAANQGLNNVQLSQIGAMGTLGQQAYQQALQPYQMLSQLYGMNLGVPAAPGKAGDPLSSLIGAGGTVGAAALMCWVAREVFGERSQRWVEFREWLLTKAPRWVCMLYLKHGKKVAEFVSCHAWTKHILRPLMNVARNSIGYA